MAEQKTKPTEVNVEEFLAGLGEDRRSEAERLVELMRAASGAEPRMWGASMIGFGEYQYRYESGHEGRSFLIGFSPRKHQHSIYVMSGLEPFEDDLKGLGKHKAGKGCLYVKRLSDIDPEALRQILDRSIAILRERHTVLD